MKNIAEIIRMLWSILSRNGRQLFFLVVCFSALTALIDVVSVSLIAPFISMATNFDFIHENKITDYFYTFFEFDSEANFIVFLGITTLLMYFFRSIASLLNFYLIARFSYTRYYYIATELFTSYLHHSLADHTKRNTSDLTRAVLTETNRLIPVLTGVLTIFTELLVFTLLYCIMLYTSWQGTLILSAIIGFIAFMLARTVTGRIEQAGIMRVHAGGRLFRLISSSFGNFRILKLQSSESNSLVGFQKECSNVANCDTKIGTLHHIPRLGLELIGFGVMIVVLASYVGTQETNIQPLIPALALFMVALYRLLPSVNRILASYNQILASSESLRVVYYDLDQPREELGEKSVDFDQQIELINVGFRYDDSHPIFEALNLKISMGERVAFVGKSGEGKSTLVDLIIGLLRPTEGKISIDGEVLTDENIRAWRAKFGYIPQTVYLFDATVKENVVFGREYDEAHLRKVLQQAKILDYLETKDGIETMVGDAGVMLSGGQRQRIAIARALYGKPEILILDEATSGLDVDTEAKILREIRDLHLKTTIITVTHRRESIDPGQTVYQLESGRLRRLANKNR